MAVALYGRRSAAAFVFASFLSSIAAQTITVGNGTSLTAGDSVKIGFHDPSRAHQTIVVTITSNGPSPVSQERTITLDASGRGSIDWTVPTWDKAYFNAPGASEVARAIM